MSMDGTYLLKYDPAVAAYGVEDYLGKDIATIKKQCPEVEIKKLRYNMLFFEMPKYTLLPETKENLHCDQILESCDGDDFTIGRSQ